MSLGGFPSGSVSKESACNIRDMGLFPGLGRSPEGGHGNPLHYSYLENPHRQKSQMRQSMWSQRVNHNCDVAHTLSSGEKSEAAGRQRDCSLQYTEFQMKELHVESSGAYQWVLLSVQQCTEKCRYISQLTETPEIVILKRTETPDIVILKSLGVRMPSAYMGLERLHVVTRQSKDSWDIVMSIEKRLTQYQV